MNYLCFDSGYELMFSIRVHSTYGNTLSAVTENEYGAYGKYGKNTEKPGSFLGLSYLGDNG